MASYLSLSPENNPTRDLSYFGKNAKLAAEVEALKKELQALKKKEADRSEWARAIKDVTRR